MCNEKNKLERLDYLQFIGESRKCSVVFWYFFNEFRYEIPNKLSLMIKIEI